MDAIRNFFSMALSFLGINFLDVIILAVFVFYVVEGFTSGFLNACIDLISFIVSFLLGLKFYAVVGGLLVTTFSLPQSFGNALGFFVVSFVIEIILSLVLKRALQFVLDRIARQKPSQILHKVNSILGIFPGFFSAFILVSFVLSLVVALPLSPFLKHAIASSRFGNVMLQNTQGVEKAVNAVFGGAIKDTLNFLTIEPESSETVTLRFKTTNVKVDPKAEADMLQLVNKERTSRGFKALVVDEALAVVGRAHAKDMLARGYFSHFTPEGLSPFDRIDKANITYSAAGENLAFAPNTQLAMQGLMNSPGHKANILEPSFGKVGIGVIDAGIYGEMFVQVFSD